MKIRSLTIRRISIAAIWLAFMIVTNILVYHAVKGRVYEQTRNDLSDQAGIVAGFVSEILRGASPEEALRFANACGAICTTRIGAGTALKNREQVLQLMNAVKATGKA